MLLPPASAEAFENIAAFGRYAAGRGWVPATSGNFSCRIDRRHAAVTRSGIDKGSIGPEGIAIVAIDEAVPPGLSAETPLHLARYRTDAEIGAIFHVHTVAATVLSKRDEARGAVRTDGLEMHKAIGVRTHAGAVEIPIFANNHDTAALAKRVEARLGAAAPVPGFLLAGHGLYAWGASAADARRHLEGLEFLLACQLEERRLR